MTRLEPTGDNAPQIEYWNGPAGDRWAQLAEGQDRMLGGLGITAIDAGDIRSGDTVLDVGCGSGSSSLEIARRVGPSGHVLGVDISTPMLEIAEARRAEAPGLPIAFENRDVATYPFDPETFDRAFSRFGVMFFIDPVAAFTNIRSGLKSGGRMTFICWQELSANPWMAIPFEVALNYLPEPPPATPRAPGPMAFAETEWIREILLGAGFADVGIADNRAKLPLAADVRASAERLCQLGPVFRLLGDAPDDIKAEVAEEIGKAIAPYQTDDGVMVDSATWIVTASNP